MNFKLQCSFIMDANTINPDMGPYCLQLQPIKVHKQMREQTTIDVNDGKRAKIKLLIHTVGHC